MISLSSFLSAYPGYGVVNVCTFDLAHTSHSVLAANLVSLLCVTSYLSTFLRSHLPTTKRDMFSLRIFAQNSLIPFALVSAALWSRHSVTRHTISQWFFRLWQMFTLNNLARESISIRSELVTVDTREKFVILEKRAFLSFFSGRNGEQERKDDTTMKFRQKAPQTCPQSAEQPEWQVQFAVRSFFTCSLFDDTLAADHDQPLRREMRRERCSTQRKIKSREKSPRGHFPMTLRWAAEHKSLDTFSAHLFCCCRNDFAHQLDGFWEQWAKNKRSKNENFLPRHLFLPSLPIPEHNVYTKFAYRVHSDK